MLRKFGKFSESFRKFSENSGNFQKVWKNSQKKGIFHRIREIFSNFETSGLVIFCLSFTLNHEMNVLLFLPERMIGSVAWEGWALSSEPISLSSFVRIKKFFLVGVSFGMIKCKPSELFAWRRWVPFYQQFGFYASLTFTLFCSKNGFHNFGNNQIESGLWHEYISFYVNL